MSRDLLGPILRTLDAANLTTLCGLVLGLGVVLLAAEGRFHAAALCLILAGLVDLADGAVARRLVRTPLQAQVGKHLDSLVDLASFGLAPALLAYHHGLNHPLTLPILALFAGAGALRLAYFDSVGLAAEGEGRFFTGLPITYASLFVPLVLVMEGWLAPEFMRGLLGGLLLVLAGCMVAPLRVPKPRARGYLLLLLLALVLGGVHLAAMVLGRP